MHNKALANIISMVKRADDLIYTATGRIDRAIASVMVGKSFNQEQIKWLDYIQEHLVQNLTIEMDNFKYALILERVGGKGKAKKVFSGGLEALIDEINAAIAASKSKQLTMGIKRVRY